MAQCFSTVCKGNAERLLFVIGNDVLFSLYQIKDLTLLFLFSVTFQEMDVLLLLCKNA